MGRADHRVGRQRMRQPAPQGLAQRDRHLLAAELGVRRVASGLAAHDPAVVVLDLHVREGDVAQHVRTGVGNVVAHDDRDRLARVRDGVERVRRRVGRTNAVDDLDRVVARRNIASNTRAERIARAHIGVDLRIAERVDGESAILRVQHEAPMPQVREAALQHELRVFWHLEGRPHVRGAAVGELVLQLERVGIGAVDTWTGTRPGPEAGLQGGGHPGGVGTVDRVRAFRRHDRQVHHRALAADDLAVGGRRRAAERGAARDREGHAGHAALALVMTQALGPPRCRGCGQSECEACPARALEISMNHVVSWAPFVDGLSRC